MIIKDLVILGRACPEPLKDGRVTVCMAGWSEAYGFIRIYPTRFDMGWKRWDVVEVPLERNPHDTRLESWKIQGSKDEWDNLASKVTVAGHIHSSKERRDMIGNLTDGCVNVINEAKRSLGIIKPQDILHTYLNPNAKYNEIFQPGLPGMTELDSGIHLKRDFTHEPRIKYRCPACQTQSGVHDQQILEWGFYGWFRKNPDNQEQVWENAGFGREDTDIYLFVGNQAAHRTSFMVISVLRVPKGPVTTSLFPLKKWLEPGQDSQENALLD